MCKVYLVGAGPGDPGLLTVKGKIILEHCDVVLYDALVAPEILALVPPNAEKLYVGKRGNHHSLPQADITKLLVQKAQTAAVVVRLKGGDPFVFGRGGEEMLALRAAGIDVEVIPGITAGIAAPAYAGIPVTHRTLSASVLFVTGHEAIGKDRPDVDWQAIATCVGTIVIYMGIHNLPLIVPQLLAGGRDPETPVAVIRWGTTPQQVELTTTLAALPEHYDSPALHPPAIVVIGEVVNLGAALG